MSDITTIARPYAKAIFQLALATNKLVDWSSVLSTLAQIVLLPEAARFINNPATTQDEQVKLLLSVIPDLKQTIEAKMIEQLVSLLAENKRLLLLPGIAAQYELLRAEQEKTMVVSVNSYTPLSQTQQQRLIETLTKRLQRQVALEISIDESLLGGALIQAGDLVIDGSVRGQLLKLQANLAA